MNIASVIDSTLLKADATREDIENLCREARESGFAAVCVNPVRLETAASALLGSSVAPCTVIAFPLGAVSPEDKAREIARVIGLGAREVDMVVNIGAIKDQDWTVVEEEIRLASHKVEDAGGILKVIVETALLTGDELKRVCLMARDLGADYIKTSTGFSTRGASLEDVRMIREFVGDEMKIKASGGIRDYQFALQLVEAGANRLGVSNARNLIK
ncbi:MAG: deoxyribose-phosphate aldolase [Syntrophomonadales bacterium]